MGMLYSIISLTQNTYNSIYKQDVAKICKKKTKDNTVIADIVAPAEQQFQTNQKTKINEKQDLAFIGEDDEEEGDDDYLAMLLGVDEEEDGEENIAGGSTPEDDIVIGSDISLGSDSENETTLQEGNIPTAQEVISIQPKESQANDNIEVGDSISMSPQEEKSKSQTPEVSETGDDIEIGDSISMSPQEEKSKSKTPEAEVSQTGDD